MKKPFFAKFLETPETDDVSHTEQDALPGSVKTGIRAGRGTRTMKAPSDGDETMKYPSDGDEIPDTL